MGFGVSGTHIIFFIAAIVVAVSVVATLSGSASRLTGGLGERSEALQDELTTDIRIINDAGDMPNNPVVLYVLNTGTRSLDPNETTVLVDGAARTDLSFDVLETSEDVWRTGQTLKVTVNNENLGGGDHRIKVIVNQAVSDTFRFSIP